MRLTLILSTLLLAVATATADDEWQAIQAQLNVSAQSIIDEWDHHHHSSPPTAINADRQHPFLAGDSDVKDLVVETRFGPVLGVFAPPVFEPDQKAVQEPVQESGDESVQESAFESGDEHVNEPVEASNVGEEERKFGRAFLGIPFVEAPVHDRRFQYSVPWTRSWLEAFGRPILKATRFGPQCVQLLSTSVLQMSEDCLYLNVYIPPANRMGSELLPVMMYVYGGAFEFGSSGIGHVEDGNMYTGSFVVRHKVQDVVVVTFNHRVGPWGFLKTKDLTGNYGLSDIVNAVKWVKQNIGSFGGDPDKITLFGLSSGAYSASMVVFNERMPSIKNAIIMSGPLTLHPKTKEEAVELGRAYLHNIGCRKDDSNCLKKAGNIRLLFGSFVTSTGWIKTILSDPLKWIPMQDDLYAPGRPLDLLRSPSPQLQRRMQSMSVMLGTAKDELTLFTAFLDVFNRFVGGTFFFLRGNETLREYLVSWLSGTRYRGRHQVPDSPNTHAARQYTNLITRMFSRDSTVLGKVLAKFPPKETFADCLENLIVLMTEYMFTCPTRRFAQDVSKWTRTYLYEFTQEPEWISNLFGRNGSITRNSVAHALDFPFFWHFFPKLPAGDEGISRMYIDYFTSLGYGDVNNASHPISLYTVHEHRNLTYWPTFTKETEWWMNLGSPRNKGTVNQGFHEDACAFWDALRSRHRDGDYPF